MSLYQCHKLKMSFLPNEVWEIVLSQVPMNDLLDSCVQVCQCWRDVIQDKNFLPWKKSYYHYKENMEMDARTKQLHESYTNRKKDAWNWKDKVKVRRHVMMVMQGNDEFFEPQDDQEDDFEEEGHDVMVMEDVMVKYDVHPLSQALPWLAEYLSANISESSAFCEIFKHSKYHFAEDWMKKNMPHLVLDSQPHPVAVIVILCALADSVYDVREIIKVLILSNNCQSLRMTELFYALALGLCYFKRKHRLPLRIHYNVLYALYLFEHGLNVKPSGDLALNESPPAAKKKRSLMDYGFSKQVEGKEPTSEQAK